MHPFEGGKGLVGLQILRHALLNKEQGHQQRERQQQPQGNARQIDPGIAEGRHFLPGEGAGQGEDHGDAGGGGEEILHRQADHLAEITHGAFAGVSLPVGIADKADRGIERQIP